MFTGIIERAGKIEALDATSDGGRLRVNFGAAWAELAAENQRQHCGEWLLPDG